MIDDWVIRYLLIGSVPLIGLVAAWCIREQFNPTGALGDFIAGLFYDDK